MTSTRPLVIVAHRLPVEAGGDRVRASPGGMLAPLSGALTEGTQWVGWAGPHGEAALPLRRGSLDLHPIPLSSAEINGYYRGFSNSVLWPLFHGKIRPLRFDRSWWQHYLAVNERFAVRVAAVAPLGGVVWIHDYHLLLVPKLLRARRPDLRIGWSLHTPFPDEQAFSTLPPRQDLVEGLLGADLLGFQVDEDVANFSAAASRIAAVEHRGRTLLHGGRASHLEALPISVDYSKWNESGRAAARQAAALRADLECENLFLGVDRVDYSKGIAHRLQAFGELLDEGLLDAASSCFVQIGVPTRAGVPGYRAERRRVEALASSINARHHRPAGPGPVVWIPSAAEERKLAAWYRAADTLVVTALADGMTLVAKEFVAARDDLEANVLLSEFARAARELEGAVVVNPYDIDAVKSSLIGAITMSKAAKRSRMYRMREQVRRYDVGAWARRFLDHLVTADSANAHGWRSSIER